MAISELFYDNRPEVLFNPRNSLRVDPRFTYTRNSTATNIDRDGNQITSPPNEPRLAFDPVTRKELGFHNEPQATNLTENSNFVVTVLGNKPDNYSGFNPSTVLPSNVLSPDGTTFLYYEGAQLNNGGGLRKFFTNLTPDGTYIISVYAKKPTSAEVDYFALNNVGNQNTLPNPYTNQPVAYYSQSGPNSGSTPWFPSARFKINVDPSLGVGTAYQVTYTLSEELKRYQIKVTADSAGSARLVISTNVENTIYPESPGGIGGDQGSLVMLWGIQLEADRLTSYIPTPIGGTATRAADLLSINKDLAASGSIFVDSQAITPAENDTILGVKNASNEKINLSYLLNSETYNSLALISSYKGQSKTNLPLPVPSTTRERNLITYGSQNYQYGETSSRYAASLSSNVPANLNQLSIGHDPAIPANGFNGYINAVYLWSGEISPAIAVALVRGEVDPAVNADTYDPSASGPAGALSMIINTQGTGSDANATFTFPAHQTGDDPVNDIVITWGDGTESGAEGLAADLGAPALTHTYSSAGIYPVFVSGNSLENIKFGGVSDAQDLLQIASWGTGNIYTSPSSMASAFSGCTQMNFTAASRSDINLPDTSAVEDWSNAFLSCSSITGAFPDFDFSAATSFSASWKDCSSLTSFTTDSTSKNLQTQNVTTLYQAWNGCSGLTSFPTLNTSSVTNFTSAWKGCISLTSFPSGIDTSSGTTFINTWEDCIGLTSFPSLTLSAGTSFSSTWKNCTGLTSFPLVNVGSSTSFFFTWNGCSGLTSFPLLDFSNSTNFRSTFTGCSSIAGAFPSVNTSLGTEFRECWEQCSSLTSFPDTGFTSAIDIGRAWRGCNSLTSFPAIDLPVCENMNRAWENCSGLTGTFASIQNTSSATNMIATWKGCSSLTGFPLIDVDSVTSFNECWTGCSSMTTFPANFFDSWAGTPLNDCFYNAWNNCPSLTATSVENILISINASGTSAPSGTGTGDKEITIDMDSSQETALRADRANTATALYTAVEALTTTKNWSIILNGTSL